MDAHATAASSTEGTKPEGEAQDTATKAAADGQGSVEFKPVYDTQLPARLQTPEIYGKLAVVGGSKLEHLVDFALGAMEKEGKLKDRVLVPTKDDPEEVWKTYHQARGVPDSAEGYEFDRTAPEFKDFPEMPGRDEFNRKLFAELKLDKDQAKKFDQAVAREFLRLAAANKAEAQKRAEGVAVKLAEVWGQDHAQKRVDLTKVIVDYYGGEENLKDPLNNPVFLERTAGLRKYMADATIRGRNTGGSKAEPTTAEEAVRQALAN